MKKVRNIKYHVCTADGQRRVFKTKSTADYFVANTTQKVTEITAVKK